jgi:hypothetical protein
MCAAAADFVALSLYLYERVMLDFIIQLSVAIGLLLVLVFLLWPVERTGTSTSGHGRP